jgi:glycosyltransferase involved in cell wall biosynthesis
MSKKVKMDKVSVITTFYNAERFVLQAVNSVNQQIIDGFEVEYVIVDDKSPDNTRKIIEDFINTHGNPAIDFRIIEPDENLGCGGARKFGIDNSTGNYLMFLDADDYYVNRDFIIRAYNTIKKEHADIVEYGVLFNQSNGQQINNSARERIVIDNPVVAEIALFKDNLIKFNVWSKIYTRDIVNTLPYSTTRTYEDVRTIPVWVSNAKKIVIMPTPEVNYRAASGSIIREDNIKTRVGTITAIAELFERDFFHSNMALMKAMYGRAMVDLEALLHNHSCKDPGFNEMSRLNTKMLKYIYPNNYKELTFHLEDEQQTIESIDTNKIDLSKIKGWEE